MLYLLLHGNAISYAIVNVGKNVFSEQSSGETLFRDIKGKDELNTYSELESNSAFRVIVSPELYSGVLIEQLKNKRMEKVINNDSEIVIYPYSSGSDMLAGITKIKVINDDYMVNEKGDLSIISLNVAKGGLRVSNSNQWLKLQSDIKNAKKNVLLVMNGNLDSFTDNDEKQLFIDVLCELKRNTGKNIWVVQTGSNIDYSMKRGVKYLTIGSSRFSSNITSEDIHNKKYILITVNDNKMTYEIKDVF